jgi:hypothetical protein
MSLHSIINQRHATAHLSPKGASVDFNIPLSGVGLSLHTDGGVLGTLAGAVSDEPVATKEAETMSTGRALIQIGYGLLSTVSMVASAYHGYKRNDVPGGSPIGWALGWGALGSLFPVITPVVAIAQGYAEPEKQK